MKCLNLDHKQNRNNCKGVTNPLRTANLRLKVKHHKVRPNMK